MKYLHKEFNLGASDIVLVDLDSQANVRLMDSSNFHSYRRGGKHTYYGGWATQTPARIRPPHSGCWHLVVDLGGRSGQIRAGIRVITC